MKSITATNARSNLFNILKNTIKGHRQIRITTKDGNAILLSEEDYESVLETAHLLSIPGFLNSIKKADKEIENKKTYSMDEVFNSKWIMKFVLQNKL